MADEVSEALSDPYAEGVVTAFVSLPVDTARQLEDEAARWGLNRGQMLVIAFRMWMTFQQYQANGLQLILVGPDGALTPVVLAAGADSPPGGYWPFGQRPAAGEVGAGGRGLE